MADISIFKTYSGYIGPEEGFPGKRGLFGMNREYRDYKKAMEAFGPIRDNAVKCLKYLQSVRHNYYPGAFQTVWNDVVNILGTLGVFSDNNLSRQASDATWTFAPGWDQNIKVVELDGPEAPWIIRDGFGFASYPDEAFMTDPWNGDGVQKEYFTNNFIPRMINFCTAIAVSNEVSPGRGFSYSGPVKSLSGDFVEPSLFDRVMEFTKRQGAPSVPEVRQMEKKFASGISQKPRSRGRKL